MSLAGKTVLVTGAGSPRGVGRAMVELFHAEGASVLAVDVDASRLEALGDRGLGNVTPVVADISSPEGADRAVDAASGHLDVLCNNAAVWDGNASIDEVSEERWAQVLAVNLTAPFLLSKRAVPIMLAQGSGVIINTAATAALRGGISGCAYAASKFGLIGLTQNLAAHFGPEGIRCNAICPGGAFDSGFTDAVEPTRRGARMKERALAVPTGPRPTVEQIAAVAVFLATDAAAQINGAALPVDGGWLVR